MFQNINENTVDSKYANNNGDKNKINIFANVFTLKNIPIYVIALMISMVGITGELSPFSISLLGACISNAVPLLGIVIFSVVGNFISFGISGALTYILMVLSLIVTMFIVKPRFNI